MTTIERAGPMTRTAFFHDPPVLAATSVEPLVFVAVRWHYGTLLLVRRCDSGAWELPGGRVDVGETAVGTAVRESAEEAGVAVQVTGLVEPAVRRGSARARGSRRPAR
jgi:8-oxo-dGTP diphosphatase